MIDCCGSILIPCVDPGGNCVTLIFLVVFAIAFGYLVCRALRTRHRPDRQTIDREKVQLADQAERFKRGLRAIAEAENPLETFIDVLQRGDNHPPPEKPK